MQNIFYNWKIFQKNIIKLECFCKMKKFSKIENFSEFCKNVFKNFYKSETLFLNFCPIKFCFKIKNLKNRIIFKYIIFVKMFLIFFQ